MDKLKNGIIKVARPAPFLSGRALVINWTKRMFTILWIIEFGITVFISHHISDRDHLLSHCNICQFG